MKSIVDYTNKLKDFFASNTALTNVESDIAYINTNSTTASKAYVASEQFILDGILRRAKTAISSGDTLQFGGNFENAPSLASVEDVTQVFSANATTITVNDVKLCQAGNVCELHLDFTYTSNMRSEVWEVVGEIASRWRPKNRVRYVVPCIADGSKFNIISFETSGLINILAGANVAGVEDFIDITYIIGN